MKRGCRICGDTNTVRSHLIPRALIHDAKGDDPNLLVGLWNTEGHYTTQSGVWDDDILCPAHEEALNAYDKYTVEFCRAFLNHTIILKPVDFTIGGVDTEKLVRFAASVVWRCNASSKFEVGSFTVGAAIERRMRDVAFNGADVSSQPAMTINGVKSKIPFMHSLVIFPKVSKLDKVRYCRFMLATIAFSIKLDDKPNREMDRIKINGRSEIRSTFLPYEGSAEYDGAIDIAKRMGRTRAGWPTRGKSPKKAKPIS